MNKKLLIVKSRSRFGMKYIPFGGKELNIGVENGPDEILTEGFLKKFNNYNILDFNFSLPENVDDDKYYSFMAKEISELSQKIKKEVIDNNIDYILNVGGDHSIASSSLLSVVKLMKDKKVGVIMFDSHGDLHLKKTSPTGNYHGMWLRPFWDIYDDIEIQKIIDISLEGDQLLFIGNLLVEEEEVNFLSNRKVKLFPSEKFSENTKEPFLNGSRVVELGTNFVLPEYRNKGIGTKLIEERLRYAKEKKWIPVSISSNEFMHKAFIRLKGILMENNPIYFDLRETLCLRCRDKEGCKCCPCKKRCAWLF